MRVQIVSFKQCLASIKLIVRQRTPIRGALHPLVDSTSTLDFDLPRIDRLTEFDSVNLA